jgi:hydroxymethylbilane synthase
MVPPTAGLKRLGLDSHIATRLPTEEFPSAVSQGAIGVCVRADDVRALQWVSALDHSPTRLAVTSERALLRRIEGGCQVPLGALARVMGDRLSLFAAVCSLDGTTLLSARGSAAATLPEAAALGIHLADELLERGAGRIIEQRRGGSKVEQR